MKTRSTVTLGLPAGLFAGRFAGLVLNPAATPMARAAMDDPAAIFGGQRFLAGDSPSGIELGDVNGDGFLDAVVGQNGDAGGLAVLIGDGTGAFSLEFSATSVGRSSFVRLGDLNGDGVLDAIVLERSDFGVTVFEGVGDGTFAFDSTFPFDGRVEAFLEDLDGDGRLDFIAASTENGGELVTRLGLAGPGIAFGPPSVTALSDTPTRLQLADIDGDSSLDAMATTDRPNQIEVLLNDGAAAFSPAPSSPVALPGQTARGFVAADLNGDTNIDLAVASFDRTLNVYLGDGAGGFAAPVISTNTQNISSRLVAGDFTGDGIVDLVASSFINDGLFVFEGVGDGSYGDPALYGSGNGTADIAVGDVNGDGLRDLVAVNLIADDITSHIGTGDDQVFTTARTFSTGADPAELVTGDFTGDGLLDVVSANVISRSITLLTGDGLGNLDGATTALGAAFGGPTGLAAADFNADGALDLAVADLLGQSAMVLFNDSEGGFTPAQTLPISGTSPSRVAAGDLDGDTDPDLVVVDLVTNDGSLFLNDGGVFAFAGTVPVAVEPRDVELIDLDSDGDLDLVTAGSGTAGGGNSGVTVSFGNGDGTFGLASQVFSGGVVASVAVGDADADGRLDLAIADLDAGAFVVFGRGDGTFTNETPLASGFNPIGIAFTDIDGDGASDVTTADVITGAMFVSRSLGDGTFADAERFAIALGQDAPFAEPGVAEFLDAADLNGDGLPDMLVAASSAEFDGGVSVALSGSEAALPCVADLDGDGVPTVFDFLAFQNLFDAGNARADLDGDGMLTIFDFLAFQDAFDAGCP